MIDKENDSDYQLIKKWLVRCLKMQATSEQILT